MKLAITTGEPAGIGPDIALDAAALDFGAELFFIGDKHILAQRAEALNRPLPENIIHISHDKEFVLNTIRFAVNGCLKGEFNAMVTCPVNKAMINESGFAFSGHTEFIAELTKTPLPVMVLANDRMRIALVTTHLALKDVPSAITKQTLRNTLHVLHSDLIKKFDIKQPRITVCGLNPHAGESGHLGTEEIEVISPVIEACRQQGMLLNGPAPADTAFCNSDADVILAMYHDQALPVIKQSGFGETVNITLGLPIIRTSVDHGTAIELAGTGKAKSDSLQAAIKMAISLC